MRDHMQPYRFDKSELHPSIADKLVGTSVFRHGEEDFEYGILDPSVAPIHYVVGMPNRQNLIASSAIPEDLLSIYLGHEIECNRLRAGELLRCVSVEQQLIGNVQRPQLQRVIEARSRTFGDLMKLYNIDPTNPANDFAREIAATAAWLEKTRTELVTDGD